MLKGMLLLIILLCCACVGRMLSNARRLRCENLAEIMASMRVLRLRMLNSMEPLGILLRKSDSALFRALGNSLREGCGLDECWQQLRTSARRSMMLASLKDEDLRILDAFFEKLGRSGREEQSELFAGIISEMEEAHQQARNRFADASKLYTALGTLIGIGVCILIV